MHTRFANNLLLHANCFYFLQPKTHLAIFTPNLNVEMEIALDTTWHVMELFTAKINQMKSNHIVVRNLLNWVEAT